MPLPRADKSTAIPIISILLCSTKDTTITPSISPWLKPVSYTHLDVYKRQRFWKEYFNRRDSL